MNMNAKLPVCKVYAFESNKMSTFIHFNGNIAAIYELEDKICCISKHQIDRDLWPVYYLLMFSRVQYFRGIYKNVYIFQMTQHSDISFLHNIDRWSTVLTKTLISRINYEILQNIRLKCSHPEFYTTWKTCRPLVSFKLGQKLTGYRIIPISPLI